VDVRIRVAILRDIEDLGPDPFREILEIVRPVLMEDDNVFCLRQEILIQTLNSSRNTDRSNVTLATKMENSIELRRSPRRMRARVEIRFFNH
jgi:hypothetical protein